MEAELLEDVTYEECPRCEAEGQVTVNGITFSCLRCKGNRYLEHGCDDA